ncbi:type I-F CRISPR-associated endoribonuclease Cas6/Csy4 [Sulfurimonas sp. SAG-AH-194-L11]|nr:type I-F CRISPR-associated endoribonuclease Cas6/Csy4 [Sulfurimonas sp. SAG-AH-194-L11]MDF1876899.1 type I-F CRISPR-associated endoribonuclease Cas6/Csy4 [Sulfurimonas sp. SAG-AH-194-L11]
MNYFIDIKLMSSKEIQENILLNQLYTNFHKRLYDLKADNIGVSFPRYKLKLGDVFRIHGEQKDLECLQKQNWLGELSKFCLVNIITEIPNNTQYRIVSRVQTTMSQSKLRRLIKRGTIKEEEIKGYKAKLFQKSLDNPFVELRSMSNGERHRRFINFSTLVNNQVTGTFDTFGLSKKATVPWF